jgi:amidase
VIGLDRYATTDALGLADLVRAGELSPAELAELALAGCARVNDRLGAVIETVSPTPAEGGSPFRGVPFLLKDLGATAAGVRSEWGSRLAAGSTADHDSELMRRFRAAGLVLVGRSAASELGLLPVTETALNGTTCSPWSASHSAGGSSGGAAAAVAAGIVPVAHANDGGGSIRVPAACCGVVGLKPSRGRVSAAPDAGDPILGWAVEFAVTRTVRDTAALLDAVAGSSPGDPYVIASHGRPFLDEVGAPPGVLRVAVCAESWSRIPVDPENAAAAAASGELLAELGHDVTEASPDLDWDAFLAVETPVWAATGAHGVQALAAAAGREPSGDTLEPITLALYEHGLRVTAGELLDAIDGMNAISRRVARLFEDVDVLLTPTLPGPPLPIGAFRARPGESTAEIAAGWERHETFTSLFNLTGQPAISLPLHHHASGLPLGIQLVGRFGAEATLIRLAAQLEEALPWRDRLPPIHVTDRHEGESDERPD